MPEIPEMQDNKEISLEFILTVIIPTSAGFLLLLILILIVCCHKRYDTSYFYGTLLYLL